MNDTNIFVIKDNEGNLDYMIISYEILNQFPDIESDQGVLGFTIADELICPQWGYRLSGHVVFDKVVELGLNPDDYASRALNKNTLTTEGLNQIRNVFYSVVNVSNKPTQDEDARFEVM